MYRYTPRGSPGGWKSRIGIGPAGPGIVRFSAFSSRTSGGSDPVSSTRSRRMSSGSRSCSGGSSTRTSASRTLKAAVSGVIADGANKAGSMPDT